MKGTAGEVDKAYVSKAKAADNSIVWVTIPVGDIERVRKFYGGNLHNTLLSLSIISVRVLFLN